MKAYIALSEVLLEKNSVSIDLSIGERSTCAFRVVDIDATESYSKGMGVSVKDDSNNILFAGIVDKVAQKRLSSAGGLIHSITCVDNAYKADKRIVAKAYANAYAGNIIRDFVDTILTNENVTYTLTSIQDGPIIEEAVFNYVRISDAIDAIAEKTGYWWRIDNSNVMWFVERATNAASWSISGVDTRISNVVVEENNSKYRNRQYIKGGRDITDALTETRIGDGATRAFLLSFPVAKVPTITLNATAVTVGIRGVDTGKQYYWSKGSNTISQDSSETLLISSDTLSVTYQGEFDVVVISEHPEEISARQTIEGGSGIVEAVDDEPQTTTREAAFQSANAKLQQYANTGKRIKFTSTEPLLPGELLTVNLPLHNFDAQVLVERVTIRNDGPTIYYSIQAAEGAVDGSWQKFFYLLANKGQAFVVRENITEDQVLITLAEFTKSWLSTDAPNLFAGLTSDGTMFPSATTYPSFASGDEVKYMELLDASDAVILRKSITKQVGGSTEINSVVYVAPWEGIGTIASVAWYGGNTATTTNGSGVQVDKQSYSKVKGELEAIQVDKTDTKGW